MKQIPQISILNSPKRQSNHTTNTTTIQNQKKTTNSRTFRTMLVWKIDLDKLSLKRITKIHGVCISIELILSKNHLKKIQLFSKHI